MDGVDFLRRLMPQYPIPVLMVSALTQKGKRITLGALEAGAVDFVTKPGVDIARGLNAMLAMRNTRARTIAQDEVSSVVFGMPKVAYERGGAERLMPLDFIADYLIEILVEREKT